MAKVLWTRDFTSHSQAMVINENGTTVSFALPNLDMAAEIDGLAFVIREYNITKVLVDNVDLMELESEINRVASYNYNYNEPIIMEVV